MMEVIIGVTEQNSLNTRDLVDKMKLVLFCSKFFINLTPSPPPLPPLPSSPSLPSYVIKGVHLSSIMFFSTECHDDVVKVVEAADRHNVCMIPFGGE